MLVPGESRLREGRHGHSAGATAVAQHQETDTQRTATGSSATSHRNVGSRHNSARAETPRRWWVNVFVWLITDIGTRQVNLRSAVRTALSGHHRFQITHREFVVLHALPSQPGDACRPAQLLPTARASDSCACRPAPNHTALARRLAGANL
jgi:hypothetical protein